MESLQLKVYGTGSSSHQLVKTKLVENLERANITYDLSEVENVNAIISEGIMSIPAIKVNGTDLYEIKPNENYNQSLRNSIQAIMKKCDYGELTKIIIPIDFSDSATNAYYYANNLAKHMAAMLQITHIYYPMSTEMNEYVALDSGGEEFHKNQLNDFVKSVNQDWIGSFMTEPMIEGIYKIGFPKVELLELSHQKNAIIMMGTTGKGDVFKKLFGSLSLDIMEHSHCPVWLIPPGVSFQKITEITYLSEDLKNDNLHLLFIGNLCLLLGARLKVLHFQTSNDTPYNVPDAIGIIENYFPDLQYHIEVDEVDTVSSAMDTLLSSASLEVLVMSTKHRNVFQNLFHNSLTEHASMNIKVPLIILGHE